MSTATRLVADRLRIILHFTRRDLRNRYLGSFSGGAWALLQPLLQLAVYTFVFGYVFKARLPGSNAPGYVAFLVAALWPWLAFSESLQRAATVLQEHAGLIAKVKLPRLVLPAAPVLASFCLHGAGFLAILVILGLTGHDVSLARLPLVLPAYALLLLFALGLGTLLSALQVFVRDIAAALPQLTMLWMFVSPVFYARETLPAPYSGWLAYNPYTAFAEYFRWALLDQAMPDVRACLVSVVAVLLVVMAGLWAFRRLGPHFEDFL